MGLFDTKDPVEEAINKAYDQKFGRDKDVEDAITRAYNEKIGPEKSIPGDIAGAVGRAGLRFVESASAVPFFLSKEVPGLEGIGDAGKPLADWAKEKRNETFFSPSVREREEPTFGKLAPVYRGGVMGAIENAPMSIAPGTIAAALGTAGGFMLGGIPGALAGGYLASGAAVLATFGPEAYSQGYKKAKEEGKDDITARSHAWDKFHTEATLEALSFFPELLLLGPGKWGKDIAKQSAKGFAKESVLQMLKTPPTLKEFGKGIARTAPFEVGTEMGQEYLGWKSEEKHGLKRPDSPAEGMAEAGFSALGMTVLFGVGAHGFTRYQQKQAVDTLSDEKADPKVRQKYVDFVAGRINEVDPDLANAWSFNANQMIAEGKPIALNTNIIEKRNQYKDTVAKYDEDLSNGAIALGHLQSAIIDVQQKDPFMAAELYSLAARKAPEIQKKQDGVSGAVEQGMPFSMANGVAQGLKMHPYDAAKALADGYLKAKTTPDINEVHQLPEAEKQHFGEIMARKLENLSKLPQKGQTLKTVQKVQAAIASLQTAPAPDARAAWKELEAEIGKAKTGTAGQVKEPGVVTPPIAETPAAPDETESLYQKSLAALEDQREAPPVTETAQQQPTSTTGVVEGPVPTEKFPLEKMSPKDIKVAPAEYQFKLEVDKKGIQSPLPSEEYNPLAGGVLLVYERKSGDRFVINGHHRLELAQRTQTPEVNVQVVKEADGYSPVDARRIAAEANILEGKGTIYDQADFFRLNKSDLSDETAKKRGLVGAGYAVGRFATDNTYAQFTARRISAEHAEVISRAAPNDEAIQAAGVKYSLAHPKADKAEIEHLQKALTLYKPAEKTGDLFDFDDSAIKESEAMSKQVATIVKGINENILAIRGAANRPEIAAKHGVNVADPEGVKKRIAELQTEKEKWAKWYLDPALVAEVRKAAGLEVKEEKAPEKTQQQKEEDFDKDIEDIDFEAEVEAARKRKAEAAAAAKAKDEEDAAKVAELERLAAEAEANRKKAEVTPPAKPAKVEDEWEEKYPWNMTLKEWLAYDVAGGEVNEATIAWHKDQVSQAIEDGEEVPANVLAEYPDLKKEPEKTPAQEAAEAKQAKLEALSAQDLVRKLKELDNKAELRRPDAMNELARRGDAVLTNLGWPTKPFAEYMEKGTGKITQLQTLPLIWDAKKGKVNPDEIWNLLENYKPVVTPKPEVKAPVTPTKEDFAAKWDAMDYGQRQDIANASVYGKQRAIVHRLSGSKWSEISEGERAELQKAAETPKAPAPAAKTPKAKPVNYGTPAEPNTVALSKFIKGYMEDNVDKGKILRGDILEAVAPLYNLSVDQITKENALDIKKVEEAIEYAIIQRANEVMANEATTEDQKWTLIKALYNTQPTLSYRTSDSIIGQKYSTPLPLAYLISRYLDLAHATRIYEPTAGNGMLLIGAKPETVIANELEKGPRLAALKDQKFGVVYNNDALQVRQKHPETWLDPEWTIDRMVMNPPFGTGVKMVIDGTHLNKLEHQIAAYSLQNLAKDGKAAIIVGGHTMVDIHRKDRAKMLEADRVFIGYLYTNFNVTHFLEINGDVYKNMGTSYPIRMFIIEGKKETPKWPGLGAGDEQLNQLRAMGMKTALSFDQVRDNLFPKEESKYGSTGVQKPVSGPAGLPGGEGGGISEVGGRPGEGVGTPAGAGGISIPAGNEPGGRGPVSGVRSEGAGEGGRAPGVAEGIPGRVEGSESVERPGAVQPERNGLIEDISPSQEPVDLEQELDNFSEDDIDNLVNGAIEAKNAPKPAPVAQIPSQTKVIKAATLSKRGYAKLRDAYPALVGREIERITPEIKARMDAEIKARQNPPDNPGDLKNLIKAAGNIGKGTADAMAGLYNIFGGNAFKSFPGAIDEDTYQKAKPYWQASLDEFKAAGKTLKEFVNYWVNRLTDAIIPHFKRFLNEIKTARVLNRNLAGEGGINQTAYVSRSQGNRGQNLVPINIQQEVSRALDVVENKYGPVDEFVTRELGYATKDELFDAFSAEQIDALALAINSAKDNRGMIVGDQTGVGKGRIVAGMMVWAIRQGKKPIFVTADPKLFTDMWRDFIGINRVMLDKASGKIFNPFIMHTDAAKASIFDEETGEKIYKPSGGSRVYTRMRSELDAWKDNPQGKVWDIKSLDQYDAIFTTYSQFQVRNSQQGIMLDLTNDNVVILDESHLAAGESERGSFFTQAIAPSSTVLYSSATWAKRPDNTGLYYRTNIGDTGMDHGDLVAAIGSGGVPLQEWISNALAKVGQYLRRELNYKGIDFPTVTDETRKDVEWKESDHVMERVRGVMDFDRSNEKRAMMQEFLKNYAHGGTSNVSRDNRWNVNSTNFASVVHNVIDEFLAGTKAEQAIEMSLQKLREGKKVIITLMHTMESFMDDHIEAEGLAVGSPMELNFSDVVRKSLRGCMRLTLKGPHGETIRIRLTPEMIAEYCPDTGQDFLDRYNSAMAHVNSLKTTVPGSFIDYVKSEIEKRAAKDPVIREKYGRIVVDEITGRKNYIDYSKDIPTLQARDPKEIKDKNGKIRGFQHGTTRVMVINGSASTGISLHAQLKLKDQSKRSMIIMQPHLDISTFMQTLGRINRKDQAVLPEYTLLKSNLPAESRPAVILQRKMNSLNANTSAKQESATTLKEKNENIPDMMNSYGDRVVTNLMRSNAELAHLLNIHPDAGEGVVSDAYKKATGKIAMLPAVMQKEFYEEIERDYANLIEHQNAMGTNRLVSRDYDLQARTLGYRELVSGSNENDPFRSSAYLERVAVKVITKPYTRARIVEIVNGYLDGKTGEQVSRNLLSKVLTDTRAYIEKLQTEAAARATQMQVVPPTGGQAQAPAGVQARVQLVTDQMQEIQRQLAGMYGQPGFVIGHTYDIPITDTVRMQAVLINIKYSEGTGSPVAPSKFQYYFALPHPMQSLMLPGSRTRDLAAARHVTSEPLRNWDSIAPQADTEIRHIMTGNLLRSYGQLNSQNQQGNALSRSRLRGEMISFTRDDGTRSLGVMLQRDADVSGLTTGEASVDTVHTYLTNDALSDTERSLSSLDRKVEMQPGIQYSQDARRSVPCYWLRVPGTQAEGAKYFTDPVLRDLVWDNNFRTWSRGRQMTATVSQENLRPLLDRLAFLGVKFMLPSQEKTGRPGSRAQFSTKTRDDLTPMRFVKVTAKDEISGKTFTAFLKNVKEDGKFISGIEVDKEGTPISGKGFDERRHMIDREAIKSFEEYGQSKHDLELYPRPQPRISSLNEAEMQKVADELGIKFQGFQEGGDRKPAYPAMFDPVTGGNFSPQPGEDIVAALNAVRKSFGVPGYAVTKEAKIEALSLESVRNIFKGQIVTRAKNGNIRVQTVGGATVEIRKVEKIDDRIRFNMAYTRELEKGEMIAGRYFEGVIDLVKGVADKWTIAHENVHFLEDMGILIKPEVEALAKHIRTLIDTGKFGKSEDNGGKEDRATFITEQLIMRSVKPDSLIGRIMDKIQKYIDRLAEAFGIRTPSMIVRSIESGEIFSRAPQNGYVSPAQYEKMAQPFYSQLLDTVAYAKDLPKKASSVVNFLLKKNVKPAEMKWYEVERWLKENQKDGMIDRLALQRYLEGQEITFKEKIKSNVPWNEYSSPDETINEEIPPQLENDLGDLGFHVAYDDVSEIYTLDSDDGAQTHSIIFGMDPAMQNHPTMVEAFQWLDRVNAQRGTEHTGEQTKFDNYVLKGATNYRELLIQLPVYQNQDHELRSNRVKELIKLRNQLQEKLDNAKLDAREELRRMIGNTDRQIDMVMKESEPRNAYKGSHWEEPNVVGHVRFNERRDANGNRVLFIEEIQSDWHQAGKEKGYVDAQKLMDERKKLGTTQHDVARFNQITNELNRTQAVPNAPLSENWHEFLMKRMIRWAAENGFERIAWTTGKTQADRYSLEKLVNAIDSEKKKSTGEWKIEVYDNKGGVHRYYLEDSKLSDYVGKELAKKIIATEGKPTSFTGLDLKVGGEGMHVFYDQLLTSFMDRYLKQWGSKVKMESVETEKIYDWGIAPGEIELAAKTWTAEKIRERVYSGEKIEGWMQVRLLNMVDGMEAGLSFADALRASGLQGQNALANNFFGMQVGRTENRETVPAYFADVTPQMRSEVMRKGQPLFQVKSGPKTYEDLKRELEDYMAQAQQEKEKPAAVQDKAVIEKGQRIKKEADYLNGSSEYKKDFFSIARDTIRNWNKGLKEGKPDTSILARTFASPEFDFQKYPAAWRVFESGLSRMDKHDIYYNRLTGSAHGKGMLTENVLFEKERPEEYQKLSSMMVEADRNKTILTQIEDPKSKQMMPLKWNVAKTMGMSFEDYLDTARERFKNDGWSDQAFNSWKNYRRMGRNSLLSLTETYRQLVADAEKNGLEVPKVIWTDENGEKIKVKLEVAESMMGDMTDFYYPRVRQQGEYVIIAKGPGKAPRYEMVDSIVGARRNLRMTQLRAEGYTEVTFEPTKGFGETVFDVAKRQSNLTAMMNAALEESNKLIKAQTLEDFGITMEEGTTKDGKPQIIIRAPYDERVNEILKGFGAQHYGEEKGTWHIVNYDPNIEQQLRDQLWEGYWHKMLFNAQVGFAHELATDLADIAKARGFRGHMIKRGMESGDQVWRGYEEDANKAWASYLGGTAAGLAKRDNAIEMVRAITGTDISWSEFEEQNPGAKYKDYQAFIKERRIDPRTQKNLYASVQSYMSEMLRNQEFADRVVGTIKGLGVLKYLGFRIAAPFVNLTALMTSVPGTFHGYGKIPFSWVPKLIGNGYSTWREYETAKKKGDFSAMNKDDLWLMNQIFDKGWHNPQYNREAMEVLRSKLRGAYETTLEWSMMMFGFTEKLNRIATITGAFNGLKKLAEKDNKPFDRMEALEKAKHISDRAHGTYGKVAYPELAQGPSMFAHAARSFYMFSKFSHTYLQTMYDIGFKEKDKKALLYMAFAPTILAGTAGIPLMNVIWWTLKNLLGGLFDSDDPEEDFYNLMERYLGMGKLTRQGVPGVLGIDMRGSLQIKGFAPTTMKDLLGAPGSVFFDLYDAGHELSRGEYWRAVEKGMPRALGTVFQAGREAEHGVTTINNTPVWFGRDQIRPSTWDTVVRSFSFNPADISEKKDILWSESKKNLKYEDMRKDIGLKIKGFATAPPEQRTYEKWAPIVEDIQDYNQRVIARKQVGIQPIIDGKWVRREMMQTVKPAKKEIIKDIRRHEATGQPI